MRRLTAFAISLILVQFAVYIAAYADGGGAKPYGIDINIGDYISFGKYENNRILWRYAADDENGKLILSDKLICYRPYVKSGRTLSLSFRNFAYHPSSWKTSFIREWLNSDASSDEADWSGTFDEDYAYKHDMDIHEKGFLHNDNFSELEKHVIKSVTQWTMLPEEELELSENDVYVAYDPIKIYRPGNPRDGGYIAYYEISELPEHYYGAACQTTDRIFLLDELQLNSICVNLGTAFAGWNREYDYESYYPRNHYFLRTQGREVVINLLYLEDKGYSFYGARGGASGIRPAFYLDEEAAVILSGSGTEEDPYVISGKPEISVLYNDVKLDFEQKPFMENDRVLIPVRAVFEALGADVKWEEEGQTIIVTDDRSTITMQIDNNIVVKDGEQFELDTAPKLVGDRTFVPLRAFSELFGAKVEWVEDEQKVVITTR